MVGPVASAIADDPVPGDVSDVIERHRHELPLSELLVTFDPPKHTLHRGLLMRLFTPKRLQENEAFMARLADRQMTLDISEDARRYIAQQGFDPVYGARPLRRFISREVETRIGRALVAGDVRDGAVIRVGLTDGELAVTYDNPA